MLPRSVAGFISVIVALVVGITVHEFAHAFTASELGDPTSRNQGRLTLNPLSHLDPVGSLMILFAGFGWGKPVPVNPYMLRTDPTVGMAVVSLAGPASNVLTALLFAIPLRLGILPSGFGSRMFPSFTSLFGTIIFINIALAVFNLIPLAPLDGYKVALAVLPREFANRLRQIETYGPIILILLVFLPNLAGVDVLGKIMFPPIRFLYSLMTGS
ncbi:MAG: site-2 protease family protein [Chloroflexi bacterium]|nr:MAG: site-2 protease family protein [Chloroflexota bacterium]